MGNIQTNVQIDEQTDAQSIIDLNSAQFSRREGGIYDRHCFLKVTCNKASYLTRCILWQGYKDTYHVLDIDNTILRATNISAVNISQRDAP